MKNIITAFFAFHFLNFGYSQTYEFINDSVVFNQKNEIYLINWFLSSSNTNSIANFNEYNLKEWWCPMSLDSVSMPSIKPFLENFNFNHLQADIIANKNDTLIDFKKLNSAFVSVNNDYINKHPENTFVQISKPYYNCSKNWVILFINKGNRSYNLGKGNICIYRKIKDKWILYHKVNLWFN